MNQPETILATNTKVITHATLGSTKGMLIGHGNLSMRKPSAEGLIRGVVGGHGLWLVWEQGDDEQFARERKASSAHQAAVDFAWWEADYGHRSLCDCSGAELPLYVRRKGANEVIPVRVSGGWHPTYQAFEGAPVKWAQKKAS